MTSAPREKTKPAAFAVCGGGTGGHIFPALAVADALRRQRPETPVYFLGKTTSMEQELAERAGLPFYGIPAAGLARNFSPRNLLVLWKAARGFMLARKRLKQLSVKAILGTGGFVCGPVILAAAALKIPSVIHESNVVPGLTNKLLGGLASVVTVGYPESLGYFPAGKTVVTGFPLRPGLNEPTREQGCARFGLDPQRPVLFIFAGSLAARRINLAVAEALPKLCQRMPALQILWMTGKADLSMAKRLAGTFGLPVLIREFVHEVPEAYACADLILARAGAGTLAEISATGKPALLVPYPFATGNHQAYNARHLVDAGAAEILTDAELNGDRVLERLAGMFRNLPALKEKATAVRAGYPQGAADAMARMMIELAERRGGFQTRPGAKNP